MSDSTENRTPHRSNLGKRAGEGGTETPTPESSTGAAKHDPTLGSREPEDDGNDRGEVEGVHGKLTGSNPDAPGYGSPSETEGA